MDISTKKGRAETREFYEDIPGAMTADLLASLRLLDEREAEIEALKAERDRAQTALRKIAEAIESAALRRTP